MCTGTCALVPAEREVHCDTTHITMVATSRALLSLVLLANLPPHADAAYECPLLVSSEQAPFRVRAVQKKENKWTGDLFLRHWQPGAQISLTWHSTVHVMQVNHADTLELRAHGITIALQASGPDDGELRVMFHISGTGAIAPSTVTCPDVGQIETQPPPLEDAVVQTEKQPAAIASSGSTGPAAAAALTAAAAAIPVALAGVRAGQGTERPQQQQVSSQSAQPTAAAGAGVGGSAGGSAGGGDDESLFPCADEQTDLSLRQVMPGAAIGPTATVDLGCDEIGLALPALRMCEPGDELSLLWLSPDTEVWQPLLNSIPSGQRLALLDGLSPLGAYQFRLRLMRTSHSRFDATDPLVLGPPTGPLLVDGAALTALLDPASGASTALQPVAVSSSSARLPWPLPSACRPRLSYSVTTRGGGAGGGGGGGGGGVEGDAGGGGGGGDANSLRESEVSAESGSLVFDRLRCPTGCRLAILPRGIDGWFPVPRLTLGFSTPPLAPIPPAGCRLELRLSTVWAVEAPFGGEANPLAAASLTHAALQSRLAHDLCPALGCRAEQVRLVEQRRGASSRGGALYVIFDLLDDGAAAAATTTVDGGGSGERERGGEGKMRACDALAHATRPDCFSHHQVDSGEGTGGQDAHLDPRCEVTRNIFRLGPTLRHFDPRGGVLELRRDGTEVHLAPWLLLGGSGDGGLLSGAETGAQTGFTSGGGLISSAVWLIGVFIYMLNVLLFTGIALCLLAVLSVAAWSHRRHGALEMPTLKADAMEAKARAHEGWRRVVDAYSVHVRPIVQPLASRARKVMLASASLLGRAASLLATITSSLCAALMQVPALERGVAVVRGECERLRLDEQLLPITRAAAQSVLSAREICAGLGAAGAVVATAVACAEEDGDEVLGHNDEEKSGYEGDAVEEDEEEVMVEVVD